MSRSLSILAPLTPDPSTCGYCSPPGQRSEEETNHHAACLMAIELSCKGYQLMIDRGWRRSGEYCYKPDLKRACCPQYTIRLDAREFKPSKNQRKLVNRFNRWILYGDEHEEKKKKGKENDVFVLEEAIHRAEQRVCLQHEVESEHRFEVTLEPSSFTNEKFELYQKYQKDIHKEHEKRAASFDRFLVESPLLQAPIPYTSGRDVPEHLPQNYGSYHQLYRIDGELIAMGVIDILPSCVSSVYFMYDTRWEKFSLGKLSALREVALAKEMHAAGAKGIEWLYMGFYVHSCVKMRYKGEYRPSYLADPEDYSWHRLEDCMSLLEKNRYACFSHPEHSIQGDYVGPPLSPKVPASLLEKALHVKSDPQSRRPIIEAVSSTTQYQSSPLTRLAIDAAVEGLGEELLEDTIFQVLYMG